MHIITRQTKANGILSRWRQRYSGDKARPDIEKALEALGPNPHPDDVDAAIGNDGWTRQRSCSECKQGRDVVQLGQEPDYESETAWICEDCARLAVHLFDVHRGN